MMNLIQLPDGSILGLNGAATGMNSRSFRSFSQVLITRVQVRPDMGTLPGLLGNPMPTGHC